MKHRTYLDYAAATPLREEAFEAMLPWLRDNTANPSALYREATDAREALEKARADVALFCSARAEGVVFTASATEANNLAIFGVARAYEKEHGRKGTIITTPIEHPSIREPIAELEREGWKVARVPVDTRGVIDLKELERACDETAVLFSYARANPDIGVVQPVQEIHKVVARARRDGYPFIHIDDAQATGLLPCSLKALGAHLLTLSSSKVYGPRGIAALVVDTAKDAQAGGRITPVVYGGGQEGGLRAGTENVAGAVGFARALSLARGEREDEAVRLAELRDTLVRAVRDRIADVRVVGPDPLDKDEREYRLPNHASFAFNNIAGDELVIRLDAKGYAVATGAACSADDDAVSQAVRAVGVPSEYERGTVRVTVGSKTTKEDIAGLVSALEEVLSIMR